MENYLEALSASEADKLKKTIAALFRQTCILQEKWDPTSLLPGDNEQYEICTKHRAFIESYLAVMDCELVHDAQEHIFRLVGDGLEAVSISRTSTIIILLIKMIYRDKIMGNGLGATVTTLEEIREYGRNTNLLNQKLTDTEWREALTLMKRHQIIEFAGALKDLEDQSPIYIYSTINLYCSSAMINELLDAYREEAANETGEEDLYTNASE